MGASKSVAIAGAGSIGCFVGGMLRAGGHPVSLLARPRVIDEIGRNGLRVTSFEGIEHRLSTAEIRLSEDPAVFADADIILVTVKSDDTAAIAEQIVQHARKDAVIVSLQNGTGNVSVLREVLPDHDVLAGMVQQAFVPILEEIRGGNQALAGLIQQLGMALQQGNSSIVAAMTVPKRVIKDANGRPVGVETILN